MKLMMTLPLICLFSPLFLQAALAQSRAGLAGKVNDVTESPVGGVRVVLVSLERAVETRSLWDGSFAFDRVAAGTYEVQVKAAGFAKQKFGLTLADGVVREPLEIVMRVGPVPDMEACGPHAAVAYGPAGDASSQLSGVVKDLTSGREIAGAEVSFARAGEEKAEFKMYSDHAGRFKFENVPSGRYDLRIVKAGYLGVDVKKLVKPHDNSVFVDASLQKRRTMLACQ